MTQSLGEDFARAVAAKDHARVLELLHPEVDFRGMTPTRIWEAATPEEIEAVLFAQWFEDKDVIEGIDALDTDSFADRERVGYRFRVRNPDGLHLCEQQAYVGERDGRIGWLRIMCAGFRPVA